MPDRAMREWEKAVKRELARQIRESGISLDSVVEWLWEDFGKRVRRDWRAVEREIVRDGEITPQDVAVFMIENDVQPDEGAWDVRPRRGLRGNPGSGGGL